MIIINQSEKSQLANQFKENQFWLISISRSGEAEINAQTLAIFCL